MHARQSQRALRHLRGVPRPVGRLLSAPGSKWCRQTLPAALRALRARSPQYGALLTTVDMKDSAAATRAIVNCVREHPPGRATQPPEPETTISGTGFFVAQNRVVTNNHVVSGCTKAIQVRYPDGRSFTATISGQDATNDLVLLDTEMPNLSVASFRFQPLLGEAVATYGFPYSGILSPNFTSGDIAAL